MLNLVFILCLMVMLGRGWLFTYTNKVGKHFTLPLVLKIE